VHQYWFFLQCLLHEQHELAFLYVPSSGQREKMKTKTVTKAAIFSWTSQKIKDYQIPKLTKTFQFQC